MLITFETIAFIGAIVFAIILFFMPTIIGIKRKVKYKWLKKDISNRVIIITQILLTIILGIAYTYAFPSKIMLYPTKICIFIFFAIILYLIFFALGAEEAKEENFFKIQAGFLVVIGILAVIVWGYGNKTEYEWLEPRVETTQYEIVYIDENTVSYVDSDGIKKEVQLSDEKVDVKLVVSQEPYLEKVITTQDIICKYNKDSNLISKEAAEYILYVPVPQ